MRSMNDLNKIKPAYRSVLQKLIPHGVTTWGFKPGSKRGRLRAKNELPGSLAASRQSFI